MSISVDFEKSWTPDWNMLYDALDHSQGSNSIFFDVVNGSLHDSMPISKIFTKNGHGLMLHSSVTELVERKKNLMRMNQMARWSRTSASTRRERQKGQYWSQGHRHQWQEDRGQSQLKKTEQLVANIAFSDGMNIMDKEFNKNLRKVKIGAKVDTSTNDRD